MAAVWKSLARGGYLSEHLRIAMYFAPHCFGVPLTTNIQNVSGLSAYRGFV